MQIDKDEWNMQIERILTGKQKTSQWDWNRFGFLKNYLIRIIVGIISTAFSHFPQKKAM